MLYILDSEYVRRFDRQGRGRCPEEPRPGECAVDEQPQTPGVPVAPDAPVRQLAILAVGVSALITAGAVYLFFAMPGLIAQGGIPAAQTDFLKLSPIFFPRLTFILLAVLGLSYFVGSVRGLASTVEGGIYREKGILPRVIILYAIAVVYPILLPWFGFVVPTIFLMAAMTLFLGIRSLWQALGFSILTPVMIRYIFTRLLAISLPDSEFDWLSDAEEALMRLIDFISPFS